MRDVEADFTKDPQKSKTFSDQYKEDITPKNNKTKDTILLGIAGLFFTFVGFLATRNSYRKIHKAAKYEFENRSSGGAVEFADYESSVRHQRKKSVAGIKYILGLIILLPLGVVLLCGFVYMLLT